MEELRSTEILDKEIKEDARKKAERILKNADAEVEAIKQEIPERLKKTRAEKEEFYNKKINAFKSNCDSAIPLEKKRKKISFISSAIEKELDKYFETLSEEKKLQIISNLLDEYKFVVENKKVKVKYSAYSKEQVEKLINEKLANSSVEEYSELTKKDSTFYDVHDGLLIESSDGDFTCRASIDEAKKRLLEEQREELMTALFGGGEIE